MTLLGCAARESGRSGEHAELQREIAGLERRIDALNAEMEKQDDQLSTVRNLAISTSEGLDSLRTTFNKNVDLRNSEKVAEMTRLGACGTETIQYPNGGFAVRNKECTAKDLR